MSTIRHKTILFSQGTGSITGSNDGLVLSNLKTGTSPNDAATKAYVDQVAQGLSVKQAVKVATTGLIDLGVTLDGVTIDGYTLQVDDRILVKNQTVLTENGIYVVRASPAIPIRSDDFNQPEDNLGGSFFFVETGTVHSDSGWVCTSNNPVTIDTTNITFAQFSGAGTIIAGTNLEKDGNTLSVVDDPTFLGVVTIDATVPSTSTATGSLIVDGGVGLSGDLFIGGNITGGSGELSITGSEFGLGILSLQSTSNSTKGYVYFPETTASTSPTNGAVVIAGGVGIAGDINTTGSAVFSPATNSGSGIALLPTNTNYDNSALFINTNVASGNRQNLRFIDCRNQNSDVISVRGDGNVSTIGTITSTNITPSTSSSTGALVVVGGVGIGCTDIAISTTEGGALTVAGGASFAENVIIGAGLTVNGLTVNGVIDGTGLNVSIPTIEIDAGTVINCNFANISTEYVRLKKLNNEFELICSFKLTDTLVPITTTSFDIELPVKATPFGNNFKLVSSVSGFYTASGNPNIISNIENLYAYGISGTVNARISFTCTDDITDDIYIQFNAKYSLN